MIQRPLERRDTLPIILAFESNTERVRNQSSETIQPFSQQKSFDRKSSLENILKKTEMLLLVGGTKMKVGKTKTSIIMNSGRTTITWMYRFVSLNFFYKNNSNSLGINEKISVWRCCGPYLE